MKFKSNQEGKCPICNSENLEYFGMELMDNSVYYPWHCPDCDTEGKEWYYTSFSEVRDIDDNVCETEGMCPNCGCEGDIEYGTAEPDGMSLKYEFHCPECENSGYEWYDLDFDSHTIDGHEDEKIELVKEDLTKNYGGQNLEKPVEAVKETFKNLETQLKTEDKNIYNVLEDLRKQKQELLDKLRELTDEKYGSVAEAEKHKDFMELSNEYNKVRDKLKRAEEIYNNATNEIDNILKEAIDYKDDRYTATTAEDTDEERAYYGKNMTKRDKVRSLDQAKRNLNRIGKDPRVTQGQAVDQVSFDDKALDTDLSRYKTNKAWAKKSAEKGDELWANEHNKTAKQFADDIRLKHSANKLKKQEAHQDRVDLYNKIKTEPRTDKYKQGLKLKDEIVKAWKNNDLETAYAKWDELHGLFSTGYDDEGNQTADWSEEQSLRDMIELTLITDTIESQCVYDVTDFGKEKTYKEMGY